jgi:hypothetical protein
VELRMWRAVEVRGCAGAGGAGMQGVQGCRRGADLQQLELAHTTQPPWHRRDHVDRQPRTTVGAPYQLGVTHGDPGHVKAHACAHEDVSDEEHLRYGHVRLQHGFTMGLWGT